MRCNEFKHEKILVKQKCKQYSIVYRLHFKERYMLSYFYEWFHCISPTFSHTAFSLPSDWRRADRWQPLCLSRDWSSHWDPQHTLAKSQWEVSWWNLAKVVEFPVSQTSTKSSIMWVNGYYLQWILLVAIILRLPFDCSSINGVGYLL